jgi:hypothetical protein
MMKLEYKPSAFQVRYAGAKGVLCTYPDMPTNKKCVRYNVQGVVLVVALP